MRTHRSFVSKPWSQVGRRGPRSRLGGLDDMKRLEAWGIWTLDTLGNRDLQS